jgi:2-keto-4-pentenoate hydratase
MADLAERIWRARADKTTLSRDEVSHLDGVISAYDVQDAAVLCAGLTRVGWKVAATSDAAQGLLGVDGPLMGPIFSETVQPTPATTEAIAAHATGIECEVAFLMGSEVHSPADRAAVIEAAEQAVIAIEIVGCRFEGGFKGAGPLVCVSDFAFNAGLVVGAPIADFADQDLSAVAAKAIVNGEVKAEGTGSAVLGDPVDALIWAAKEASNIGHPLQAGDIVSTGTMTGLTPVAAGDHVIGDFGTLGTVEIKF